MKTFFMKVFVNLVSLMGDEPVFDGELTKNSSGEDIRNACESVMRNLIDTFNSVHEGSKVTAVPFAELPNDDVSWDINLGVLSNMAVAHEADVWNTNLFQKLAEDLNEAYGADVSRGIDIRRQTFAPKLGDALVATGDVLRERFNPDVKLAIFAPDDPTRSEMAYFHHIMGADTPANVQLYPENYAVVWLKLQDMRDDPDETEVS